eukprot:2878847-Rhodomonas_salina.1
MPGTATALVSYARPRRCPVLTWAMLVVGGGLRESVAPGRAAYLPMGLLRDVRYYRCLHAVGTQFD